MKSVKKVSYFFSGMLTAFLLIGLITPALAAGMTKQIEVSTGISVYVDDAKLNPKDANGNPVDIFSYNGTTYLPVRAICDAFGVSVQWEESTQSAYLGNHTVTPTAQQSNVFSGIPEKNGFNKATNITYTAGNIAFSIPAYYERDENPSIFYAETGGKLAMLKVATSDIDFSSFSAEEIQELLNLASQNYIDSFQNGKLVDSVSTLIAGLPARTVMFYSDIQADGGAFRFYQKFSMVASVNDNKYYMISFGQTDNTQYNYFPDFDKILESATIITSDGENNTGKSPAANSPSSSNTPSAGSNSQTTKPSETSTPSSPNTPSAGSNSQTTKPSGTSTQNQSRTVYVTPTGKRYHYSSSCNGGSYSPATLEEAIKRGLSPCEKCVG